MRAFAAGVVTAVLSFVVLFGVPAQAAFRLEWDEDAERQNGIVGQPGSGHLLSDGQQGGFPAFSSRPKASEFRVRETAPEGLEGSSGDDAFWKALSNCEDPTGHTGSQFIGYFEFHPGTASQVGLHGGQSYEQQKAGAQEWARRLAAEGTSPGSTAGWPVCWWKAKAAVGYAPY